jgi:transcriptional regulator with XRE-family HTH domain
VAEAGGHEGGTSHGRAIESASRIGHRFMSTEVRPDGDAEADNLGERLRELRMAQGLTQQDVATRSGLSRAFLSQVERNQVSPSVASVTRIARALNLSMSGLFARRENVEGIVRGDKRVVVHYGNYQDELVSPSLSGQLLVLVCRVEPGASSGDELYSHDADEECVFLLEGTLDITVEHSTHRLLPGDALTFASRRGHGWSNPGTEPAAALWVMTPPRY